MTLLTPYYQDDMATLYLGDCREVIPLVEADVLVTDPPYGVAFSGKATKDRKRNDTYTVPDSDIGVEAVRLALGRVKRGAVFSGTRLMYRYPEPADTGCVYTPSGAGLGRWGWAMFHPVLYYGTRPGNGAHPASMQSFAKATDINGHPCPKPLRWMTWLVSLTSLPGEVVLDPFAGSGTTLVAAKSLGRTSIGIEIEERYCEVAANRLRQDTLGLVL